MPTLQLTDQSLLNSFENTSSGTSLQVPGKSCSSQAGQVRTDTIGRVVDLPVPVVSEKSVMLETLPISKKKLTHENPSPMSTTILTIAEVHAPVEPHAVALSATACEFVPAVDPAPSDTRHYPPGLAGDGAEWSLSDSAWIALEYGKEHPCSYVPEKAAEPDIVNTNILKKLEVKLSNGGIFTDKVLPVPAEEFTPNTKFNKEYFLDLHLKVREYNTYNYAGARVKLHHSNLNIDLFRHHLKDYDDLEILSYLEFGFPLGLAQEVFLEPLTRNHSSSNKYYSYVDSFLSKGLLYAECSGPWSESPLHPLMTSPMMTADKAPNSRRSVFDASYGDYSLNQNTPEKEYLGEDYQFKFPSVLDLADLVVKLGKGCLLYKRDLSRWFLQLPLDPGDYDKLGFVWRGSFWLFVCYVWGTRHAGYNAQ